VKLGAHAQVDAALIRAKVVARLVRGWPLSRSAALKLYPAGKSSALGELLRFCGRMSAARVDRGGGCRQPGLVYQN